MCTALLTGSPALLHSASWYTLGLGLGTFLRLSLNPSQVTPFILIALIYIPNPHFQLRSLFWASNLCTWLTLKSTAWMCHRGPKLNRFINALRIFTGLLAHFPCSCFVLLFFIPITTLSANSVDSNKQTNKMYNVLPDSPCHPPIALLQTTAKVIPSTSPRTLHSEGGVGFF